MDVLGTKTLRGLLEERERRDGDRSFLVHEDRAGHVATLIYGQLVPKTSIGKIEKKTLRQRAREANAGGVKSNG